MVKLQAEMTRDQNRLDELRIQRVALEAGLNRLLDRPARSPIGKVVLERRGEVAVDYDRLFGLGRNQRPEAIGALLRVEKDEKRIELARRDYWPDVTVGASFVNVLGRDIENPPPDNGKNVWALSASVNIPIQRRKYDAAVQEAAEDKIASQEGYRDVVSSIEEAIRTAGFTLETKSEQIRLFESTLQPQAEQALRSAEAAYSSGTLGVLDLLDSERVLLNIRLGLAQLNTDYMKALADMERAIGGAFPEVSK